MVRPSVPIRAPTKCRVDLYREATPDSFRHPYSLRLRDISRWGRSLSIVAVPTWWKQGPGKGCGGSARPAESRVKPTLAQGRGLADLVRFGRPLRCAGALCRSRFSRAAVTRGAAISLLTRLRSRPFPIWQRGGPRIMFCANFTWRGN
jgi:hypothetical protein